MSNRAHLRYVATNADGELLPYVSVRVYLDDGISAYRGPIYRDQSSGATYPNPFVAAPAEIDFYLPDPQRIYLGITTAAASNEVFTPLLDVAPDADGMVHLDSGVFSVSGEAADGAVLRASDSSTGYWFTPGLAVHDHQGAAAEATVVGPAGSWVPQVASYVDATIVGSDSSQSTGQSVILRTFDQVADAADVWGNLEQGKWNFWDRVDTTVLFGRWGFTGSTTLGANALASGTDSTAIGTSAQTANEEALTGEQSTALGARSFAVDSSTAAGRAEAFADHAVVAGDEAWSDGTDSVVLGAQARGTDSGVALGYRSGDLAEGAPYSIGLGAQVRHVDPAVARHGEWTAVLGAAQGLSLALPTRSRPTIWAQAHLQSLIAGALNAEGNASVAGSGGAVGFYGERPVPQASLGEIEVASGNEALDSLVYALRDLGLITPKPTAQPVPASGDLGEARAAAVAFLATQQDGAGAQINLAADYLYQGSPVAVAGRVTGLPAPSSTPTPLLTISSACLPFNYVGRVAGTWKYIGTPANYLVEVYLLPTASTPGWPSQYRMGRFGLSNNGTWSSGILFARRGFKRYRLVLKSDFSEVATDPWLPGVLYDTAVKLYTMDSAGAATLNDTVVVAADGTFFGTVRNPGYVRAECVRRSSGAVLASTNRPLPLAWIPSPSDADYTGALLTRATLYDSAMAALYLASSTDYGALARACGIVRRFMSLQQSDGSLLDAYNATTFAADSTTVTLRDLCWIGLAACRCAQRSPDREALYGFATRIASYLIANQAVSGSFPDITGGSTFSTETTAAAYFFFREMTTGDGYQGYATNVRDSLLANHWDSVLHRWRQATGASSESVRADLFGALFALAVGDDTKVQQTLRHLATYRLRGVAISDDVYAGPSGLTGYRPYGPTGHPTPPAVVDQEATWLSVMLRQALGLSPNEDLNSLLRWKTIIGPNGGRFLNYSQDSAAHGLVTRPRLSVAAMVALVLGGRSL